MNGERSTEPQAGNMKRFAANGSQHGTPIHATDNEPQPDVGIELPPGAFGRLFVVVMRKEETIET